MDHYYSSDPTSESNEKLIEYEINGKNMQFITDNGVFSKAHVDFATNFMLNTIINDVKGKVLDMGCGYGVIGIAVASNSNVKEVMMCDVNHRALELAKRNAIKNQINHFTIIESNGFENIKEKYDTIITNPPIRAGKSVIYKMYEDSKKHLNPDGNFYLVINKKHGAPSTITYLKEIYTHVEVLDKKAGFHVIKCFQ